MTTEPTTDTPEPATPLQGALVTLVDLYGWVKQRQGVAAGTTDAKEIGARADQIFAAITGLAGALHVQPPVDR